jgi:4-hydroxy-tetrahydrodipicolinate synthase
LALNFGISPALVTPFTVDGVDVRRLADHTQDCLDRGCRTATVFGTTGEGPSVSALDRDRVAGELVSMGLAAGRLVEGVIACSIEEAVFSTGQALRRGAHAVLLAPPFYFRQAPDEAVFAWYEAVFRALGSDLRDILLYHIPGMTGVPLTHPVIRRLATEFPGAIRGVKDSAGDPDATFALIDAFPDLDILVGDETYLGRACGAGAAGSICGAANVAPEAMIALAEKGQDDPHVVSLVREIISHPIIPMVKALVAHVKGDRAWARPRPPLQTLSDESAAAAIALLAPVMRRTEAVA